MLTQFEKKIADFIFANELFPESSRIILAVSGGADSIALLHTMDSLKSNGILKSNLFCIHFNHQLRGSESDGDEHFVIEQAMRLNLPVKAERLDVKTFAKKEKLSIETAARKLRMQSLLEIAESNDCTHIATAHHKDDNAETVLQRLVRGTGYRGLAGIWPKRTLEGDIIFARPMLAVSRKEIVDYLEEKKIPWRVDSTNADCSYRRNFIRHRLIPHLQQKCSAPVADHLFELSRSALALHNMISGRSEKVWPEISECSETHVSLLIMPFLNQPQPVQVELIRRSLTALGSGERDLDSVQLEKILQLANQQISNRKIELPGGFLVSREYRRLTFESAKGFSQTENKKHESAIINIPGNTSFAGHSIEACVFDVYHCDIAGFKQNKTAYMEWFDLDKINLPLTARMRKIGDKFIPLGQAQEKKLGKFLTDARVSLQSRQNTIVVDDGEKIIWLWPIRISDVAKVSRTTKKILQLKIT